MAAELPPRVALPLNPPFAKGEVHRDERALLRISNFNKPLKEIVRNEIPDSVRLDKWLWAARFFKTRQLAIEAVNAGHVELNGERAKPAKSLKPGDEVRVRKPPYEFTLLVKALSEKRGPVAVARELFTETAQSIAAREKLQAELREMPAPIFKGRPTKRDRRALAKFFDSSEGEP